MKLEAVIFTCFFICAVALLLLLQGCALTPVVPYDTTEKIMIGTAIGGQAADYATTAHGLDNGCVEGNPLMPDNKEGILAVKIAITALGIGLVNGMDDHRSRKFILGALSVVGFGAAGWNLAQECH